MYYATDSNSQNFTQQGIAYISCDGSAYAGNLAAFDVLKTVYQQFEARAAILYSTSSNYCNYTAVDQTLGQLPIYSTTTMLHAQNIKDTLEQHNPGMKYFRRITRSGSPDDNSGNGQGSGQSNGSPNPLGPSPSTAVAMIILYSITGVITALFLVIIITGAVRAHRHPDRYGPRDVMGRPRQSRARGLGMAILDTIPIVKFGEREQPKTTDVELGSTTEPRDVNTADANPETAPVATTAESRRATTETPRDTTAGAEHIRALDSGIAPAQSDAVAAVPQTNTSPDEGLGCPICTDDFEKSQDIRVLRCNHKFHTECVDPWLRNVSGTCPLW